MFHNFPCRDFLDFFSVVPWKAAKPKQIQQEHNSDLVDDSILGKGTRSWDDSKKQDCCEIHEAGTGDGKKSFLDVPPDYWCVSQADLRDFRDKVRRAIRMGEIQHDPDDDRIGPCIHTVVKFIKHVLAKKGESSWALMRNPNGLRCDVFVTHGWMEGIFEFIDKVLHSWPRGMKGAYCCMLSNPQNNDIGCLIANPLASPFAEALGSSQCMLVVPNRKCSIYSRIWCTYEAYLAYRWHKMIFMAEPRILGFWWQLLLVVLETLVSFGCGHVIWHLKLHSIERGLYLIYHGYFIVGLTCGIAAAVLSFNRPNFTITRVVNHTVAWIIGFGHYLFQTVVTVLPTHFWHWWFMGYLASIALMVGLEVDRMHLGRASIEAEKLQCRFTGDVRDAQSSNPKDKEAILDEINTSGRLEEVNRAIKILLHAKISTNNLRQAAACGVDVLSTGGGYSGMLRISCFLAVFFMHSFWGVLGILRSETGYGTLGGMILGVSLCWTLFLVGRSFEKSFDVIAFAGMVGFKSLIFFLMPVLLIVSIIDFGTHGGLSEDMTEHVLLPRIDKLLSVMLPVSLICLSVSCVLAALGLPSIAAVPKVGPWMADLLLARNPQRLFHICHRIWVARSEDELLRSMTYLSR